MNYDSLQRKVIALLTAAPDQHDDAYMRRFRETRDWLAHTIEECVDHHRLADLHDLMLAMEVRAVLLRAPPVMRCAPRDTHQPAADLPPLIRAIGGGDIQAVQSLISKTDVNKPLGKMAATPLYTAMGQAPLSLEIVTLLLNHGADPRRGLGQANVLHALAFAGADGVTPEDLGLTIRRCVTLGADLEQRDAHLGCTPLLMAALEWNATVVEALLLAGANPSARAAATLSQADAYAFARGHAATGDVLRRFSQARQI
ncbi:MAG: hypothetical protein AAF943_12335 [Pseudomonadota bacterium]